MKVSVYRYNPETDKKPYMMDFDVVIPEGKDPMVLDVLNLIKEQDPTLAFRRSCREGVCGSDGLEYWRHQWFGVHHTAVNGCQRQQEAGDPTAAGVASDQGSGGGYESVLQTVRKGQTIPDQRHADTSH